MIDLAKRIESSLAQLCVVPWLPNLTSDLAEAGWRSLRHESGMTPDTYGTSRLLSKDEAQPRCIVAEINSFSSNEDPAQSLAVEVLSGAVGNYYENMGVRFYTAKELTETEILHRVAEAVGIICKVPNLARTVAALARVLHILKPEDNDCDISFSEPHVPFSIFVSAPVDSTVNDSLRIAEGIVHEAMHLQLTLIEQALPLVRATSGEHFSPWRGEYRDVRGVLHGLYVFCVVDQFFRLLLSTYEWETKSVEHLKARRAEIQSQVGEVLSLQFSADLTEAGRKFTCSLIKN